MKDWPYPRIFAHRGGGSLAPENTLAAIRTGQSLGYAAHEFDVKLSRDAVALLLHDTTLERTTTGKGRAADLDWHDLGKLDAGAWHSAPFRGEKLPTFEEAAKLLRSKDTMANVEIKPTPGFEVETGRQVALDAARFWEGAKVAPLLSSFSYEALMAAKEAAPQAREGVHRGGLVAPEGARGRVLPHRPSQARHRRHRAAARRGLSRDGLHRERRGDGREADGGGGGWDLYRQPWRVCAALSRRYRPSLKGLKTITRKSGVRTEVTEKPDG